MANVEDLAGANPRVVKQSKVSLSPSDEYVVSTVCTTGNDISDDPIKQLFVDFGALGGYATGGYETMVFPFSQWEKGGSLTNLYARRYTTKELAETGHTETVGRLLTGDLTLDHDRTRLYDDDY